MNESLSKLAAVKIDAAKQDLSEWQEKAAQPDSSIAQLQVATRLQILGIKPCLQLAKEQGEDVSALEDELLKLANQFNSLLHQLLTIRLQSAHSLLTTIAELEEIATTADDQDVITQAQTMIRQNGLLLRYTVEDAIKRAGGLHAVSEDDLSTYCQYLQNAKHAGADVMDLEFQIEQERKERWLREIAPKSVTPTAEQTFLEF